MRRAVLAATLALFCAAAGSGDIVVQQAGQVFDVKSLDLKAGDAVDFQNRDDVIHNIVVIRGDEDPTDLGLQKPGETIRYLFDKSGRFKIRCNIHPSMRLNVTVE